MAGPTNREPFRTSAIGLCYLSPCKRPELIKRCNRTRICSSKISHIAGEETEAPGRLQCLDESVYAKWTRRNQMSQRMLPLGGCIRGRADCLVVVNEDAKPVGIITDRDLFPLLLTVRNPTETSLSEIMTPAPKTVSEETPIESALAIMRSGRFRRLPVVDHDNKLVGLVTLDDILMLLAEEFVQIGGLLERETPRSVIEDRDSSSTGVRRFRNPARL